MFERRLKILLGIILAFTLVQIALTRRTPG